jgi:hypothetical protein
MINVTENCNNWGAQLEVFGFFCGVHHGADSRRRRRHDGLAMTPRTAAFAGVVAFSALALARPGFACGADEAQPSAYQFGSVACPTVADVKTMPSYEETGYDAAYDRFVFANDCDHVLIETLTSLRPMADPRCPHYSGFVEADAALFMLATKQDIDISDLMPDSERANWKAQGVYAYFSYVEDPKRRAKANARLLALIAKQKNEAKS